MEKQRNAPMEAQRFDPKNPHLPQEIIDQIMVRLPVKSLLRFKCVSKLWCLLISGDGFIKAHLVKSSKDKSFRHHSMIIGKSIVRANQFFLPSFWHETRATAVRFDYPTFDQFDRVGYCNGLVCILRDRSDFILWNPSTRKFKELPSFVGDHGRDEVHAYGFGFDESNDEYKVFCNWSPLTSREYEMISSVYSSKTDSWRKVDVPIDSNIEFYGPGIFVSGKLHWNADSHSEVRDIVSFDLENEKYGTVGWPSGTENGVLGHAIDGYLCCRSPSNSKPKYTDYWLMKEYGMKDSWYKFVTLRRVRLGYFYPLLVGANGDILVWSDYYYLALFKGDGRYCSSPVELKETQRPFIYVESLVEP